MEDDVIGIYQTVLRECFCYLGNTIDPLVIRGKLYEKGVITYEYMVKIGQDRVKTHSAEDLILYIINKCPTKIPILLNILEEPESGYGFLAKDLKRKISEKQTKCQKDEIQMPITINLFTEHRKISVKFRHRMKRLSQSGDMKTFLSEQQKWIKAWKNADRITMTTEEFTQCADMYFMALDSELEHRRVVKDATLYEDDIFYRVRNVIPDTSQPVLTTMMYLARFGSAMVVAGHPLEKGIDTVKKAMGHFHSIPACRETGIVLYIYFNMLSVIYESQPTLEMKEQLLNIAHRAIHHFQRENEQMGMDFKRMVLIKIAYVQLGLGVSCNQLKNIDVTSENSKLGMDCLNEVRNKSEMWDRMEPRWKMFYYCAQARVETLRSDTESAKVYVKKAKKFLNKGKFSSQEERNLRQFYSNLVDDKMSSMYQFKTVIFVPSILSVMFFMAICYLLCMYTTKGDMLISFLSVQRYESP